MPCPDQRHPDILFGDEPTGALNNGRLDERWLRWFEGYTVVYHDNGKTLIVLTAVDQPALFGVFNRIRDLGLELISVQKDELQ